MVLPFLQRGGYGKFIIEFSYALSIKGRKARNSRAAAFRLGPSDPTCHFGVIKILKLLLEQDTS